MAIKFLNTVQVDTDVLYVDTTNDRVGIGTSTPGSVLDVQGTQGQLFSVTDNLSGEIFAVSDISGVPIMTVNSSGVSYFDGNVGIGTTSPSGRLNIQSSAASTYLLNLDYADGTDGGGFYEASSTDLNLFLKNSSGTNTVTIATDGDSYFNGGKVGIGTDNPSSGLTISSSAGGDNTWDESGILIQNLSTTTGESAVVFKNSGTEGTGSNYWFTGLNQSNIYKLAYGTNFENGFALFELNTSGALTLNAYDSTNNTGTPTYLLGTDASGNVVKTNTVPGSGTGPYLPLSAGSGEILTGDLAMNNNIGIITKDSTGSFRDVLKLNSSNILEIGSSSLNTDTIFKNTGNVGIGETNPVAKLHLKGSFNSQFFTQSTGGTTNKFGISSGTAYTSFTVGSSITTAARFYHDNSYITFAENGANVGIGTTSPVAKLDVLGTSSGPVVFDYVYATNAGVRIHGDESAMDIVGTDSGNHASTILLRNGNEGFGLLNNPNLNTLQFRSFTANADGFNIHDTGTNLDSLVDIVTLEKNGNVGINTTSPDFKLDVDGTFGVSDLPGNGSSTSVLVQDQTTTSLTVLNGDFAADSDWIKGVGWTISGGKANVDGTQTGTTYLYQGGILPNPPENIEYIITYTVSNYSAGEFRINVGGYTSSAPAQVANGTYEVKVTPTHTSSNTNIYVGANADTIGSVDNISVKQVTAGTNQIQTRELGTGAFGPTPVGAYLPLTAGSGSPLTGTLYGTKATFGDTNIDVATVTIEGGQAGILDIWRNVTNASYQAIRFRDDTNANTEASVGWSSNQLRLNGTSTIVATTGGSERMRIDSSGNVGIGTTVPSHKLSVEGSANNADIGIRINNTFDDNLATSNPNAGVFLNAASNNGYLRVHGAPANTAAKHQIDLGSTAATSFLTFSPSGSEKMRIDSSGNVGIGTSFSQTRLQTNSAITGTYLGYLNGITATFDMSANVAVVHNSSAIGTGTGGGLVLANNDNTNGAPSPIIAFSAKSASNSYNHTYAAIYGIRTATGADTNWTKGDIVLATGESTGPIERMRITSTGDVILKSALLSNQANTDIDTGAEVVAQVAHATYTAAFFDFVVKKGTNIRSGTVYACHDGTNVEFTETSTQDLGDTSDVVLSVDKTSTDLRLIATVASDDWSVKSLIRAI